jgi:hypothetical protein
VSVCNTCQLIEYAHHAKVPASGFLFHAQLSLSSTAACHQPFNLTKAEVLQLLNAVPKTPVEVHLLVEDCEERLQEEEVESLLHLVQLHLCQ